ncbi:MAG: family 16 glycosylhydrolase, partial [Bacteroidota bacterium]
TSAFAQSTPFFNAGQNPAPPGKMWQKIDNMSDEFNGTSLNTAKWDNQFSGWKGRAPALFSVNAVTVGGGDLKIEAADDLTQQEKNQNPGFTHQGGLVRSINKTTYGYFETRMKANRTCLSSTFWLINQKNEFSGCDKRVTELDVVETVGVNAYPDDPGKDWITNTTVRNMNSNTHSRNVDGNPGCGINVGQQGAKAPLGEEAWEDYHVYGVWWKNATEVILFLDGQEVNTVTPPADFDLDMYLRMVVESYDWNKPRAGFDNMNLTQADRTTYYDWTRSWKLVDDPNAGTASVDCNSLPGSVATSTSIPVSINYTADQSRDVVVELWNTTTNSWLAQGTTTVGAGSGTANVTINISPAPAPGSNYQFKGSIRPVGGNWTTNLDACSKSGINLTTAGGPPDVDCNSLPSSVITGTSLSVSVDYTADQNRDIVIELWNTSTNSWLAQGSTTVGAGTGTANVNISLGTAPAPGSNYQFKASIRPVGGNWTTNLDACNKSGITLSSGNPEVFCNTLPSSVATSTSISASINYTADQNRDVVIELWNTSTNSWLGQGTTTVSAGGGTANVTINLNSAPPTGSNYQFKASIRPVGANWTQNLDACNISNVTLTNSNRQGRADLEGLQLATVYPNPITQNQTFTLSLGEAGAERQITIFDAVGRRVHQAQSTASHLKLNGASLFRAKGLYLISVQQADQPEQLMNLIVR